MPFYVFCLLLCGWRNLSVLLIGIYYWTSIFASLFHSQSFQFSLGIEDNQKFTSNLNTTKVNTDFFLKKKKKIKLNISSDELSIHGNPKWLIESFLKICTQLPITCLGSFWLYFGTQAHVFQFAVGSLTFFCIEYF